MAAPGQDAQLHFWALEGSDARHPCPAPCTEPLHGSLPAPAAASRRKTEPCKTTTASQEGAGLMQLHSPPQQVSPRPTASKGRTSVAVPLQETSLEVTLHSSLISQSSLPLGSTTGSPVFFHMRNAFWDGQALLKLQQQVWSQVNHLTETSRVYSHRDRNKKFSCLSAPHPSHFQPQRNYYQTVNPSATLPYFPWYIFHQLRYFPSNF